MKSSQRRIASSLMDLGSLVLPPSRSEWYKAMSAELTHVSDAEAIRFAAGCLFTCFGERFRAMANIPPVAHFTLLAAIVLLAALTARSSFHMNDAHPVNASIFAGVAASYLLAALWSMLRGAGGLVQAAIALLILNSGTVAWLQLRGAATGMKFDGPLISAVALEGAIVWLAILAVCLFCSRSTAHAR